MIKLLTPLSQIDKDINVFIENGLTSVADELCRLGAMCVKIAKDLPQNGSRAGYPVPYEVLPPHQENYVDWTQNLRKSIGWAVIKEGKVYDVDLGPIGNTRLLFEDIKSNYLSGIHLLVMATGKDEREGINYGKPYASYVQALGYDVLKTSQLKGDELARQTLNKLFRA